MNQPAISVRNLGKKYRLGATLKHDTLRDHLAHGAKTLLQPFFWNSEDRGQRTDGPTSGQQTSDLRAPASDEFWALRDVSFEVQQGEILGIIGRNGAGKSTLLKILSQITEPTSGEVRIRGRVASLLEVGTGFHPELSGRENIYLNGSILGMTHAEIRSRFDEIVDFSGVARFLETPVKRYSSGMYVRLAFAVAAHLEPEILILDEVLAVGDAEFQKRCLATMRNVANVGRTILFVSHNMNAVRLLCDRAIWLTHGSVTQDGPANEITGSYMQSLVQLATRTQIEFEDDPDKEFQLLFGRVTSDRGTRSDQFSCDQPLIIELTCRSRTPLPGLYGSFVLARSDCPVVLHSDSRDNPPNPFDRMAPGVYQLRLEIPARSLGPGTYSLNVSFGYAVYGDIRQAEDPGFILSFDLHDFRTRRGDTRPGFFSTLLQWHVTAANH